MASPMAMSLRVGARALTACSARSGPCSLSSIGLGARPLVAAVAPIQRVSQIGGYGAPPNRLKVSAAVSEVSPAEPRLKATQEPQPPEEDTWQVKILYDGDCPICMKEVDFLEKRNESYKTLKFVDISAEDYSPDDNAGISFEAAMGHIHGITRDGQVLVGIEAFRKFYEVIGLGWVYAVTKFKPVQAVADAAYNVWAKYRLPLSGRPSLDALLEERRRAKYGVQGCNEEDPCEVKDW